jgi:hypothetical protein
MKTILLALCFLLPKLAFCEATERSNLAVVRAKIVSIPKDFEFPGSSDADGKEQTVKPQKAHSSELQIITPNDLTGKTITFYHLPPLKGDSIWHRVGTIIEFQIDRESLGSMYPRKDRRHTFKIPYVHNIAGEIKVIQKPEAEQAGTGQPATRPESDSEGGDKPQPVSEGRSR